MIQNTTFLRRAVGSLLVALVTLVGFQANAQALDFTALDRHHVADEDGPGRTSYFKVALTLATLNAKNCYGSLPCQYMRHCYQVVSALEHSTECF